MRFLLQFLLLSMACFQGAFAQGAAADKPQTDPRRRRRRQDLGLPEPRPHRRGADLRARPDQLPADRQRRRRRLDRRRGRAEDRQGAARRRLRAAPAGHDPDRADPQQPDLDPRPGRQARPLSRSRSSAAKVSEMIAAAGGVLPAGADVVTLVGNRNGKPVKLDIDLPAILQSGKGRARRRGRERRHHLRRPRADGLHLRRSAAPGRSCASSAA